MIIKIQKTQYSNKEQQIETNNQEKQKFFDLNYNINPTIYQLTSLKYVLLKKNFEIICEEQSYIFVSGRLLNFRHMGKIAFGKLQDNEHSIQLVFKEKITENYNKWISKIGIGDLLALKVTLGYTKTEEQSLFIKKLIYCKKSLININKNVINLPKHKSGFIEPQLIFNINIQKNIRYRNEVLYNIRNFLYKRDFIEVQTNILNSYFSGFVSKPFTTKYLRKQKFLRSSPELILKRLIVTGFHKIFEIGKNFRNEHKDRYHNYEFTMLEFYASYNSIQSLLQLIKIMLCEIGLTVFNTSCFKFNNNIIDLNINSYKEVRIFEYLKETLNFDFVENSVLQCRQFIETQLPKKMTISNDLQKSLKNKKLDNLEIGYLIFSDLSTNFTGITIISDIPSSVSILSKKQFNNLKFANRYEILFNGIEIINMYDELNDYDIQKQNFKNLPNISENFLQSIKLGLPPVTGVGIGIDRLLMLYTESTHIRDVINNYD